MDRVADRGMIILIWQLSPSQSFLAHSTVRHSGVCMVISCAHLNRILDTGMLSLRLHYSISVPTGDGRLTMEKTQNRTWKRCTSCVCTFPLHLSKGEGLAALHVDTVLPRKRYRVQNGLCVQCCREGAAKNMTQEISSRYFHNSFIHIQDLKVEEP